AGAEHGHEEHAGHGTHLGRNDQASRTATSSHGHGHGGIHESPAIMLVPLVILAILSIVGGWIGVPGSLGGSDRFDKFLGPVFRASTPAVSGEHAQPGEAAPPEQETEGTEPKTGHGTELVFTGISVAAGLF